VTSPAGASKGDQFTATASCPAGKVLYGGGGKVTVSAPSEIWRGALPQSFPFDSTTWEAVGMVINSDLGAGTTLTVTAYALCSA